MSDVIHNIQSLMITDKPGLSLVDQINRRLAAVATIGRRYGNEGKGVFIKRLSLSDFYDFTGDFEICISPDIVVCGHSYDHPYKTTNSADSIITSVFRALQEFFIQEIPKLNNIRNWDVRVVLPEDIVITMFCATDTLLPIGLAEPIYISSENVRDAVKESRFFSSKFAVMCYTTGVKENENSEIALEYSAAFWGIGMTKTGTLLFNGLETDIQIAGARGDSSQIIMASARTSVQSLPYLSESVISINNNTYSDPGLLTAKNKGTLIVNGTVITDRNWESGDGETIYALVPQNAFLSQIQNDGIELYKGAIVFSFLTVTDNNGLNNIYMTILRYMGPDSTDTGFYQIYDENLWVPIQTGFSDSNCSIFTFSEFLCSSAVFDTVIDSIEDYIAGTVKRSNDWFRFTNIRFNNTGKTIFQTSRADVSATGTYEGYFRLSPVLNPVGAQSNESLPVLSLRFSDKYSDFRKYLKDADNLSGAMLGTLYDDGYDNKGTDMFSCIPLLYLSDTGMFCPNVVNSARVYGLGSDCCGTFNNSEDNWNQVPYIELTGYGLSFNLLQRIGENVSDTTIVNIALNPDYNSIGKVNTEYETYSLVADAINVNTKYHYNKIYIQTEQGTIIHGDKGVYVESDDIKGHVIILPDSYAFNGEKTTIIDAFGITTEEDGDALNIYGNNIVFNDNINIGYDIGIAGINGITSHTEIELFEPEYLNKDGIKITNKHSGISTWKYSAASYNNTSEHPIIVKYKGIEYLIDIKYAEDNKYAYVQRENGILYRFALPIVDGKPVCLCSNLWVNLDLNNLPIAELYPENNLFNNLNVE